MKIRQAERKDVAAMLDVAAALPQWFTEHARTEDMPIDFSLQRGFVAEDTNGIVGFTTYTSTHGSVELMWFGVKPNYHRKGIGAKLLAALEDELRSIGLTELRVDTVADSVNYKPYELTRAFYKKMGFTVEKVSLFEPPDGSESYDIATYIKHI